MISPKELFKRTMPFTLARLKLALLLAFLSGILLAVCMLLEDRLGASAAEFINSLIDEDLGEDGPTIAMLCIWLAGTVGLHFLIINYAGYLLKAAHVAVISETLTTGNVPENQMAFGKQAVLQRFLNIHAYLVLDRLVAGAVNQLCKAVDKVGESLEKIPGVSAISGLIQLFLRIALGHVDECCMAYSFYRKDSSTFKSATNGIVLYFQNWKVLAKTAAALTLLSLVLYALLGLVSLILFIVFMDDGLSLFAVYVASFFFWVIKAAFIDSWLMVRMVADFFEKAKDMEPALDVSNKLAGLSSRFKELRQHPEPSPAQGQ